MVNRHRLYWSAMGSPSADEEIQRKMDEREVWHKSCLDFWKRNKISFEDAFKRDNLKKVIGLKKGRFHWTLEGLEDVYLFRMEPK